MIELITKLLNAVMAALNKIAGFSPADLIPDIPNPFAQAPKPPEDVSSGGTWGNNSAEHLVTDPENIGANFYSTNSPAWKDQEGGQHFGTDFRADEGSAVYMPFAGRIIKVAFYDDEYRYGYYMIATLEDGTEYYSGHLKNVTVKTGDDVPEGTKIGETNNKNHTHVQIKINGVKQDFEEYRRDKK